MNAKNVLPILLIALTASGVGYFLGSAGSGDELPDTAAETGLAAAENQSKILYWRAPMDPTEIYEAPGKSSMGMDLVPVYQDELSSNDGELILINPSTVQNMGVRSVFVSKMDFSRVIRTVGEVTYDEEHIYQVNTRISGWIEALYVNYVGAPVQEGDPLMVIYSPELVTTQEEYLLAARAVRQAEKSESPAALADARRLLGSVRLRLENWEISEDVIRRLEETQEVSRTVLLRSPATGIVNQKNAIEGAHVAAGMDLLQIADLRTVWVHASFYENESPWILEGQPVEMELSYLPGKKYEGTVSYVYPYLREKARDVHVRLIFSNPSLDLKPGMYVNVQLQGRMIPDAIVVPVESVIRSGERTIVFVVRGKGRFEPREVEIAEEGGPGNAFVRILSGLAEKEEVVVSAQFLLDSESRLQEAIRKMIDLPTGQGNSHQEADAGIMDMSTSSDTTARR